jgi:hypothetical protein
MSGRKAAKATPEVVQVRSPETRGGKLKALGGSTDDNFNHILGSQVIQALWPAQSGSEEREKQLQAAMSAMMGVQPRDELEGMLAAQMVATHESAMDCFRRAELPGQTFEGRRMNLEFANKLVRSYATLVETLDRHRGKGQPQVVRVEHVTVNAGGQAIVGAVSHQRGGGGDGRQSAERSHAQAALAHAPEPPMRSPDQEREPVPVARSEGQAAL